MTTATASTAANCFPTGEAKLRKKLRVAEANLDFANSGSLTLIGLSVAALAILAALASQGSMHPHQWAVGLVLGLLILVTGVSGIVLACLRPWYAGRIVQAEDELAFYRRAAAQPIVPVGASDRSSVGYDPRPCVVVIVALGFAAGLAFLARP